MLSSGFSSTVLHGMKRQGFTDAALAKITGLTPTRLKSVLAARAGLTDRQLDSVEEAAGMTVGELAARHLEPQGGSFTELAAMLADCRSRPLRRSRNTRKRAS